LRAVLQKHFGLGVKESQPVVSRNPSPFFQNVAPGSEVPDGRVQLQKYRHFVIVAELKEHAFGDSYSLELSCEWRIFVRGFSQTLGASGLMNRLPGRHLWRRGNVFRASCRADSPAGDVVCGLSRPSCSRQHSEFLSCTLAGRSHIPNRH